MRRRQPSKASNVVATRAAARARPSRCAPFVVVGVVATILNFTSGTAWGYLAASGAGTGHATVGTLTAPGVPAYTSTATKISWSAPSQPSAGTVHYTVYAGTPSGTSSAVTGCSDITTGTTCTPTATPTGTYFVRAFVGSTNPTAGFHATSSTATL